MAIVLGTNGPDTLNSLDGVTNGADSIFGLGGSDVISGGLGADSIFGGNGIDTASYTDSAAAVQVSLVTGSGTGGTAEGDALDGIEYLAGSSFDDLLIGDNTGNVLSGLGDADTLMGGGSGDTLYGGDGDDTLKGGGGGDTLQGNTGIDTATYAGSNAGVIVSLHADTASGGDAEGDELNSIENLTGSSHNDQLWGNDGANVLNGMNGNDTLKGYGGDDTLLGGNNNDTLLGQDGDDTLNGDGGNDTINGGGGEDTLNGGSGIDTAAYSQSADRVIVALITDTASSGDAEGDELNSIENLSGSTHNDTLWGNNGVNVLKGLNGDDTLKGYGGEDALFGGNNNDTLLGLNDDDTLNGENGSDTLDGGAGNDTMIGGLGNDTFVVDSANDVVDEDSFEGNDTIKASVDYQLAAGVWVETLRTVDDTDTTAIDLTGNGAANNIIGNAGVNILDGKNGADTMSGLAGNDIYYVNDLGDTTVEAADSGSDIVRATQTYILTAGASVEGLTTTDVTGLTSMTLVGNDLAQTIQGNAAINVLRGFAGDDFLQGMGGNDTLTGHAGNDKFLFNTALNAATNVDTITDMTVAADIIRLDDAIFTQAGAVGALNADAFHIGAAAADAEDRIIYDNTTGDLFYDSNGTGAGGSTLFAHLTAGLALTNVDFAVV